ETWINCRAIKGNEEFGFGSTRDELRAREVLAYSSNAGAHRIAELVGKTRFARSISAFGFGAPTGVYLSPESSGTVHDPEKWSASSLSRIGIGYEVAVTPLQMLMAFSAVVNGGELLRPQVLSRLESSRGEVLYERQREFRQRVLSREAAHELRSMLRSVVEAGGTGSKADIRGWEVVGKTGTARRFSPEMGAYEKGEYTVSFVGALPAPDPQFSCIVVMDRPQVAASQRSGGALAAPIFQKIAEASIDYLDLIPPGEG
ncbi:MAG: penicillin-binding transpeptidase domain-containing protein, partial [Verrucomicrobiota bacterium]